MRARFLLSTLTEFPTLKDPKGQLFPEIALAGKSNVGKSSLINHLLNQKTAAKTSATPGKTRLINFFSIDERFLLVDLPGYGYAKVHREEVAKWSEAIDNYLNNRPTLRLLLLLIDSRRDISPEDQALIDWAVSQGVAYLLVFTKMDKLSAGEKIALMRKHPHDTFYSTANNDSRHILAKRIEQILWA
jgi:GTP-binding protein